MDIEIIGTEIGLLKIVSKNGIVYESYFTNKGRITSHRDILDYLDGTTGIKYKIRGTTFQRLVWREIARIPFGETRTYGQIAEAIGNPQAYRAVANACGQNKIAVIIPCHRVVGKNNLGGYKWGTHIKKWFLGYEQTE